MDDISWLSPTRHHGRAVGFVVLDILKELPPEQGWPLLLEHQQALELLNSPPNQGVSNG